MSNVVLGVGGGIAAYKGAEILRRFSESGHRVRVVPTAAALKFVGAPTWEALSGQPVSTDVFTSVPEVPHVSIGQSADLVVVAPATADLLAKAAHGLADDLLTNTLLTARCPVVMAPAMHTEMWEHAATQANVATLRSRGVIVLEPAVGRLTGKDTGKGRLPDPGEVVEAALAVLARDEARTNDLGDVRVLISAGGTREYLDPVRYLGNRSSGRQGIAIAQAAVSRGAKVTLVAANVSVPVPAGVDVVRVETTAELHDAMLERAGSADVVVMAAAPADFRPAAVAATKIKKDDAGSVPQVTLVQNPDILRDLVERRSGAAAPLIVGFAAETGDDSAGVLDHARAKLARKGCDFLVLNDVSGGKAFDRADNEVVVLGRDGSVAEVPYGPKVAVAHAIWDTVAQRLDNG
ncbi:bifunctional phosphopantothenoylcysteine decarboxylase/phosphopantothenate--cysteine ligase CoaBC [Mumia sp. zg.B17]|uniref:bifunctional phosphopantothenoylcysteine decarboxylase/phosphopantothenate--cysteine ligase CoaBC n=1 Tax=unclassified Mumia TaxID=2621872 RepID=UPI001C6EE87D|nr:MULTISPECIES: bifunctional phosphopantothenoylcysteine decarboxylase/phosphopantothenate--cysteine ligase CoaBC [unclassified Mumia]MBW9206022.1 bifunctional phosphopantothenoylcysteine decarboxylase/phosphopantothenate--cysteine ligase CoaBC [Mumia sp. zg.B17]MBW9211696.1 bifunctional phosphopantothenoylcysteine decarboxylase/phosphopantothenate--cysteine ligase CoaBC [Mumia sp. zg.B21]